MIPINDPAFHTLSMERLSAFVPQNYKGRLVQIFLAAKFHGDAFPRVGSNIRIGVGDFQYFLDSFYKKESRADKDGSIAIIFRNSYLVPSGQIGAALTGPSNIWRNNFGIQKAIICYATENELLNDGFVRDTRLNCPHLRNTEAGLRGAHCEFHPDAKYRGEDGPKLLRRDPTDEGFAIVQPGNVDLWRDVIRANGRRLPLLPLVGALYHDSGIAAGRSTVQPIDFMIDFNFSLDEYQAYFDDDLTQADNAALAALRKDLNWDDLAIPQSAAPGAPAEGDTAPKKIRKGSSKKTLDINDLPELPPVLSPPAGGHWWSAERAVADYLREKGWTVVDRTRQVVGFDFQVIDPTSGITYYAEVKSSAGTCRPTLTANEYEAAKRYGKSYVIAIVENYAPDEPLRVYWLHDPCKFEMTERSTTEHTLARSIWRKNFSPVIHPG